VKVGHSVSVDEGVHVLGAEHLALGASNFVRHATDGLGLLVGQITESRRVALRLDHQIAAIGGRTVERVRVSDVDELVLKQDTTLGRVTPPVFLADEAVHVFSLALSPRPNGWGRETRPGAAGGPRPSPKHAAEATSARSRGAGVQRSNELSQNAVPERTALSAECSQHPAISQAGSCGGLQTLEMKVEVIEDPSPEDRQVIVGRLVAWNLTVAPPEKHRKLVVLAHEGDELIGGLVGHTHWTGSSSAISGSPMSNAAPESERG